jgi:hypothetical protein
LVVKSICTRLQAGLGEGVRELELLPNSAAWQNHRLRAVKQRSHPSNELDLPVFLLGHAFLQRHKGWIGGSDLQILIVRSSPTLRRYPVDDLVRILDVAGLAVHAVGGVDLQALAGGFIASTTIS